MKMSSYTESKLFDYFRDKEVEENKLHLFISSFKIGLESEFPNQNYFYILGKTFSYLFNSRKEVEAFIDYVYNLLLRDDIVFKIQNSFILGYLDGKNGKKIDVNYCK